MADNYVLIGFMGAGKTSIGKLLAKRSGKTFLDTDEMIVKQMNLSINEIFSVYGEEYFRDLETNLLKVLCNSVHDSVISVGGGTPIREENRTYLKKLGTVIYLSVTENTVIKRLKGDKTRPLLQGTKEEVREKVSKLLNERESKYVAGSHHIVKVDRMNKEEIIEKIMSFDQED